MAHEDNVDAELSAADPGPSSNPGGELDPTAASPAPAGPVPQVARNGATSNGDIAAADADEATPTPSHQMGTGVPPKNQAVQNVGRLLPYPSFNIPRELVKAPPLLDMVNSSTARMARDMATIANMPRFDLPRIEPLVFTALSDPTFRKTLNDFTQTLIITQGSFALSLSESQPWRQMIESIQTAQRLLLTQQAALLRDALRQHTEFIVSIINSTANFQAVASSFSRALDISWHQLFPNLKPLRKAVRTSLLTAFLRAELWPAPSMPATLLEQIGQLADRSDRRPVMLAVWNHYARGNHAALEQAIAAWDDDPEYAARRQIFRDALTAHRQKLYTVTIPTLLAQVEGIAGACVHESVSAGQAPKLGKSKQVVLHAVEEAGNAGVTDPDDAELLHVVLVEAVIQHVQSVSFENTDFAAHYADIRKRRTLNRHGTLHGIQINYAYAMNSLRCFLLLDALYALRKHARKIAAQPPPTATP